MDQPPKILYKYQAYNSNALKNLLNGCIFFSKPIRFNDPFEFLMDIDIPRERWEENFNKIKKRMIEEESIPASKITPKTAYEAGEPIIKALTELILNKRNRLLSENGVACFSKVYDNILMWSHYADGHRGFCIGYSNLEYLFQGKIKKVDYISDNKIPLLTDVEQLLDDDAFPELMKRMTLSKSKRWKYEKEWRAFHIEGDKSYFVGFGSIKKIYFGAKMDKDSRRSIISIFTDSPDAKTIKYFEMILDKREYKLIRKGYS